MESYLTLGLLLLTGAAGALAKEIIEDGRLILPKKMNGELCLGFVGSIVIGAMAGILVDGSLVTSFLAGYAGFAVIENLSKTKDVGIIKKDKLN